MKRALSVIAIALASLLPASSREAKEYDKDVNYDNKKTPHYDLPPLLVTSQGKKITTADEWHNIRRPEILSLFSTLVYGRVPEPASPLKVEFEVVRTDPDFMKGKATRKDVKIHLSNKNGRMSIHFLVFVPNNAVKPVPAFFKHSFNNTQSNDFNASALRPGKLRNGWPLGEFFDRGYGFCAVYHEDLVRHNEVEFLRSIHKLFYPKGQSFPKAHEWGVLSACNTGSGKGAGAEAVSGLGRAFFYAGTRVLGARNVMTLPADTMTSKGSPTPRAGRSSSARSPTSQRGPGWSCSAAAMSAGSTSTPTTR